MRFLALMALWTLWASGADPTPVHDIRLASALRCKSPFHTPVALQFAPSKDRLAVIFQHEPDQKGSVAHLVVLSTTTGKVLRPPTYIPGPAMRTTEREYIAVPGGPGVPSQPGACLWWSRDGDYVAVMGVKAVIVLKADEPTRCEVALEDARAVPAGFAADNALLAGQSPPFHRYYADCVPRRSAEETPPDPPPFPAQERIVHPIYGATVLELAATVAASSAGRGGGSPPGMLGCAVRQGKDKDKEILRWSPGKMQDAGVPQLAGRKVRAVCALSPSGDVLAAANGLRVRLYRLPPD